MTLTRCKQKGELQTSCMNILPNNSLILYNVHCQDAFVHHPYDELESEYMATIC